MMMMLTQRRTIVRSGIHCYNGLVRLFPTTCAATRSRTTNIRRRTASSSSTSSTTASSVAAQTKSRKDAQRSAYEYYRRQQENSLYYKLFGRRKRAREEMLLSREERNVRFAWYLAAVVVGAVGATYAAVPLYKVFCQTTGFGGTTQRLDNQGIIGTILSTIQDATAKLVGGGGDGTTAAGIMSSAGSSSKARVHTWTDEDAEKRLAELRPVKNADLLTIRFDTTVGSDALPWSFQPVQLDVKVVPGETALSFFRVTNHSKKPITGVATYNVHPPKVGLYFTKIQCFCFEEQRLLPGETVDMPVFFFIDPDFCNDPQVSYVRSITLSYTFFPTDEEDEEDDDDEDDDEDNDDESA